MNAVENKSCINCESVLDCGTINKYLITYSKSELLKSLTKINTDEKECPNFSFVAITGEILKRKLEKLINLSIEKKASLKQAKNYK